MIIEEIIERVEKMEWGEDYTEEMCWGFDDTKERVLKLLKDLKAHKADENWWIMALNQSKSLEIATTETLDFILYTTYTPLMKITYRNKITKPLTLEQQVSLTTDYNSGMSNKDLEKKYQITKQTIYNVLRKQVN